MGINTLTQERKDLTKNNALTIGIIFDASSANYGEGIANTIELKKITKRGKTHTRISRQAILHDIRTQLSYSGYELALVTGDEEGKKKEAKKEVESKVGDESVEESDASKKSVIQFHPDASIDNFLEMDLFGYMRTKTNSSADTRTAVARITDATSLYPYSYDVDFLTNLGLAQRINQYNSIVNAEIHSSLYEYSITIDLDKVGVLNGEDRISEEEKARRVFYFLKTIENLYRDIRGKRESFEPVFVIGGIYPIKNNYFNGRLMLKGNDLSLDILKETIERPMVKKNTKVGILSDIFPNEKDIRATFEESNVEVLTVHQYFNSLRKQACNYYGIEEIRGNWEI